MSPVVTHPNIQQGSVSGTSVRLLWEENIHFPQVLQVFVVPFGTTKRLEFPCHLMHPVQVVLCDQNIHCELLDMLSVFRAAQMAFDMLNAFRV